MKGETVRNRAAFTLPGAAERGTTKHALAVSEKASIRVVAYVGKA